MPQKPSSLPATINSMEPGTLVVSYGFKGNRPPETYANGSSISLGAAAFMFPSGHPAPVPSPVFLQNITPTVGVDAKSAKWWQEHKSAYRATLENQLERPHAAEKFLNWMVEVTAHAGRSTPVILLAPSHRYNGRHMADMLEEIASIIIRVPTTLAHQGNIPQWEALPPWVYADIAEMLSGLTRHPEQEAMATFAHFMPKELFHIANLDSLEHGLAFFRTLRALNYSAQAANRPPEKAPSNVIPLPTKRR